MENQPNASPETYSVQEVANLLGFSVRTVIRWFEREPGVLTIQRPEALHKRRYRTFRIPRQVYERVRRRITLKPC